MAHPVNNKVLEEFRQLNPVEYLKETSEHKAMLVYPCPQCGELVTKRVTSLRACYSPLCTGCSGYVIREGNSRLVLEEFKSMHPVRYIKGSMSSESRHTSIEYPCPVCGRLVVKTVSHLRRGDTRYCSVCSDKYHGALYDNKLYPVDLAGWRRKVCRSFGIPLSKVIGLQAHHVISRGNLMALGSEAFRAYVYSLRNCVFLTAEQHSRVHAGSYTPDDGDLYILQQINFNSDITQIGRFHPLYFVKE